MAGKHSGAVQPFIVVTHTAERASADDPTRVSADIQAAVRWVNEHAHEFGIDAQRLALLWAEGNAVNSALTALLSQRDSGRAEVVKLGVLCYANAREPGRGAPAPVWHGASGFSRSKLSFSDAWFMIESLAWRCCINRS